MSLRPYLLLLVLGSGLIAACTPSNATDCDGAACVCTDNADCADGETCNAYGTCQAPALCRSNQECGAGFICDTAAEGRCIPEDSCTQDRQCALNNICEVQDGASSGECASGCRDSGDCAIGFFCEDGQCEASFETVSGEAECSACPQEEGGPFCDGGEVCRDGRCEDLPGRQGLCASCDEGLCPQGFNCVVDSASCTCRAGTCYPSGESCAQDSDCVDGCTASRICVSSCRDDDDCPSGFSACERGLTSLKECSTDADCMTPELQALGVSAPCIAFDESSVRVCAVSSPIVCANLAGQCGAEGRCERITADGPVPTTQACSVDDDCAFDATELDVAGKRAYLCQRRAGFCAKNDALTCDQIDDYSPCALGAL